MTDTMTDTAAPELAGSKRGRVAVVAGTIAVVAIPLMTIGRYAGLWSPVFAIPALLANVITLFAALLAIILGLIGVMTRRGRPWSAYPVRSSLLALLLGLVMISVIVAYSAGRMKYPVIHDVTTDTDNPPKFVALQAERSAMRAPNTTAYNPAVAAKQKQGFPDLAPKILPLQAGEAFNRALDAAKAMGWRIAATEPSEGRIEAVATTFWAGFIDDVVIRVTPMGENQSRVDVRSESRVGGGDMGANGRRIEKFLAQLQ
jgi:uncharacterized protein (DUF1499 family)